jgi:hypothetical protein
MESCSGSTKTRRSSRLSSIVSVAFAIAFALLALNLSPSIAHADPVAPSISGPTALQFIYHPRGFRGLISWNRVHTATEYRVYDADTTELISTVATPTFMLYGMQGVEYRLYVVAVDPAGDTSSPSNTLSIQAVAPVLPSLPSSFTAVPMSSFDLQTSAPPLVAVSVRVPYSPAQVAGDPSLLRLMHFADGSWEDITTTVDTDNGFVSGTASSFSLFSVMEPAAVSQYTITPSAGANGAISPATAQQVASGSDSTTFTITPDAGFHVADVLVDGESVGPVTSYVFSRVAADHSIAATFVQNQVFVDTVTTLTGSSSATRSRTTMYYGRVSPLSAIGTVRVLRFRLAGRVWRSEGSATVPVVAGSYSYRFTPSSSGTWRLVAKYSGGVEGATTYAPSTSPAKTVEVQQTMPRIDRRAWVR